MYRCFEEKMHLKANLLQKNFPANAFRLQCSDLTSYNLHKRNIFQGRLVLKVPQQKQK